ncbi:MAG TPA: tripartite tricarboxylate transporter substrate binding protein [Burkholderiaceae bacterium]|nr:tripartite tricarboxylate transporter substrate binding protein [Burkholderiaceae bacterium]
MKTLDWNTSADVAAARRRILAAGAGALAAGLAPSALRAQAWPSRPIRLVAAQAPGSSNDATARAWAEYLSTRLNTSVVVENKPGAAGMIAAEMVARSAPDGHTFLVTLHSQLAQAPVLLKKPPIDTSKDLVPIAMMSTGTSPAVVKKDLPVNNLKELVELARKRPVTVGNYSIGSGWQMMVSSMAKDTGAQFDIIHYKGTGPMMVDLMSGQIDMGAGSLAGIGPAIQRGAVRPVALISGRQTDRLPGVQTLAEQGFVGPAYQNLQECNMMLGPAGTPPDVVERLGALIAESGTRSDKVRNVLDTLVVNEPMLTGAALRAFIDRTWPVYQAMTRELKITVD